MRFRFISHEIDSSSRISLGYAICSDGITTELRRDHSYRRRFVVCSLQASTAGWLRPCFGALLRWLVR